MGSLELDRKIKWFAKLNRLLLMEPGFDGLMISVPPPNPSDVLLITREAEMQRRCDRNRKRSKPRAIYCPVHGNYLESVSQKYRLFANQASQLQERGMSRRGALLLVATNTTVSLDGEWLEAFWCEHCQEKKWYHVRKMGDRNYELAIAPGELWQQVAGVVHPHGNPSVGEFTRRQSRMVGFNGVKDFSFVV